MCVYNIYRYIFHNRKPELTFWPTQLSVCEYIYTHIYTYICNVYHSALKSGKGGISIQNHHIIIMIVFSQGSPEK